MVRVSPTETGVLLDWIAAIDNREVTTESMDAWSEVLDPNIRLQDAKWAARQHFANRPGDYLTPGYINAAVREVRRQRVRDMRSEPPPPDDLTPLEAIAWSKAYIAAVANGEPDPDTTACTQLGITRRVIEPTVTPQQLTQHIADAGRRSA